MKDLIIGGRKFTNRFFLGTGKFDSTVILFGQMGHPTPPSLEVCNTKRSVPMGTPASRYNTPCQPHFVTLNAHFLLCMSKGSTCFFS